MNWLRIVIALLIGIAWNPLEALAQRRGEFRAAWVATVFNLDFPSKSGLSADAQQREILRILDAAKSARLNALLVQVRPEADALYESGLEPWSRFLTGSQGRSPGYDPLSFFINEGRKRDIQIHAWINPYRASVNNTNARARNHVTSKYPGSVLRVRNLLWLDPGSRDVQNHTVQVVRDIVRRYPVAGIHLDDYFYPYPVDARKDVAFADDASFSRYQGGGGRLGKADWRRENVNTLVREIGRAIKSERKGVLFGVSPFGIYTKGQPADVDVRLDQYEQLYADPVRWMREGWVDYLAPQLYWRDQSPQSFSRLLRWWRDPRVNPRNIPIYPGIAIDRLGGSHNWPVSEIDKQLQIERSMLPAGGFVLFRMQMLVNNDKGVRDVVSSR